MSVTLRETAERDVVAQESSEDCVDTNYRELRSTSDSRPMQQVGHQGGTPSLVVGECGAYNCPAMSGVGLLSALHQQLWSFEVHYVHQVRTSPNSTMPNS